MNVRNLIVSVDELDTLEKFNLAVDCYRSARLPLGPWVKFGAPSNPFLGMGNFYVGYITHMPGRNVVSLDALVELAQPKRKRRLAGITELVLSQAATLTNRQVADKLGLSLDVVKNIRRNHSVIHAKRPKDRGLRDKILACSPDASPAEVAKALGCTANYVSAVRRQVAP